MVAVGFASAGHFANGEVALFAGETRAKRGGSRWDSLGSVDMNTCFHGSIYVWARPSIVPGVI